jgi:hypothetical protein
MPGGSCLYCLIERLKLTGDDWRPSGHEIATRR